MAEKSVIEVNDVLKPLLMKDLRTNCRARNLNPGGSKEALVERLSDDMRKSRDYTVVTDLNGGGQQSVENQAPNQFRSAPVGNNYARADGQNCGNFISDRPSSRVLAPPGGGSQISFGNEPAPASTPSSQTSLHMSGGPAGSPTSNNYHRPGGQNVGNFLTDRNSSRVSAPPGGASQITFG